MTKLWLSRARIRRDAAVATLAPMLLPEREDDRVASSHRLIWSLFAHEGPESKRNFLWREDRSGYFYMLSATAPSLTNALLEVDSPKPFEPVFAVGDRLRFSLRANPTVSRPTDQFRTKNRSASAKPSRKTAHHDVVMHAIHALPSGARAEVRNAAIEKAGSQWLVSQGLRSGFRLGGSPGPQGEEGGVSALRVDGYRVLRPPRPSRSAHMRIGILEFDGVLTVTDPAIFLAALARGFGRAKAYGCGLMLVARV